MVRTDREKLVHNNDFIIVIITIYLYINRVIKTLSWTILKKIDTNGIRIMIVI